MDFFLSREGFYGRGIKVVIVVVGYDEDIDLRQLLDAQCRRCRALGSERRHSGGVIRQERVGQDRLAAKFDEKARMPQPGQGIASLDPLQSVTDLVGRKNVLRRQGWFVTDDAFPHPVGVGGDGIAKVTSVFGAAGRVAEAALDVVFGRPLNMGAGRPASTQNQQNEHRNRPPEHRFPPQFFLHVHTPLRIARTTPPVASGF